jgi:hypothetical protein
MGNPWYLGLVDVERYPIHDLQSPLRAGLVREFRARMDQIGVAEVEGFLTPEGVRRMTEESAALEAQAHHNALVGNAYLDDPDASLPEDHARRLTEKTSLGAIAYDQIPESHLIRQVFEWDALMHFIGDILGLEKIYRYADPMGALNIAVMRDGDYLRWHFDQTDFVTSLSIRNAEAGGEFEFAPMLRTPNQENYGQVKAVLQGARERVKHLANRPGTLVLFKGRYSLHRVTPIVGATSRLMGLFGYDSKPGTRSSEYLQRIRYGRVKEAKI